MTDVTDVFNMIDITDMTNVTMYLTIVICAVIMILLFYFLSKPTRKSVANAPSVLTSIGIFGTFLGIAIGLTRFETGNIVGSVPVLLGGIKLAFWSSVFGIAAALIHKIKFIDTPFDAVETASEDQVLARMTSSLANLEALTEGQSQNIFEKFEGSSALDKLDAIGTKLDSGLGKVSASLGNLESLAGRQSETKSTLDKLDSIGEKIESGLYSVGDSLTDLKTSLSAGYDQDFFDRTQGASMLGKLDTINDQLEAGFGSASDSMLGKLDSLGDRLEAGFGSASDSMLGKLDSIGDKLESGFGSSRDSMLGKLDAIGDKLEAGFGASSASLLGKLDTIGETLGMGFGSVNESLGALGQESTKESDVVKAQMQRMLDELKRESAVDQAQSESLLQVFGDLKEQIDASNAFEKQMVGKLSEVRSQLAVEADLARQMSADQMKSFLANLEGFSGDSVAELGNLSERMESNLGALMRSNREIVGEEFAAVQAQLESARERDEQIAANFATLSTSSTKSMLVMLKEILDSSENANKQITNELAKLREDVAADIRATTSQTDSMIEQLRVMTDSYKATIISTTTDLKVQISKDMKSNYQLLDQYTRTVGEVADKHQAEALERLEGIATIMQSVVSSSSDMATLLHDNSIAMNRMQDLFTSTSEGSLGRFLLNMNNDTLEQLASIERSFSSQGSLGALMRDINVENLSQLKSIEKELKTNQEAVRELPVKLTKSFKKASKKDEE